MLRREVEANRVAYEAKSFGYSVPTFSDADGEPLTYQFSGLPAWLKVSTPDVNPRYISGRPPLTESSPAGNTTHVIMLTATDPSGAAASRSFNVVVADNRYPVPSAITGQTATENVAYSYNMPAFRSRRVIFYFAAFKKHIGIYPPVTQDAALVREVAPYRGEKGNLSFPLGQPLRKRFSRPVP